HTDDVSFYPTTNSDGKWVTGTTTRDLSSGLASSQVLPTPLITGYFIAKEEVEFDVTIPGTLGPWDSISIVGKITDNTDIESTVFEIDNVPQSDVVADVKSSSFEVDSDHHFEGSNSEVKVSTRARVLGSGDITEAVTIIISRGSGTGNAKREVNSYELSFTLYQNDGASSSASVSDVGSSASASSASASGSSLSSGVTSSASRALSTSTDVVVSQSSTVVTITSCSGGVCTKVPVETGVTVITTTTNGVETIYTTYCPLTASTATVEAEHTTVVTVTSCSGGVCTKVPVETGVAVITTTTNGVETIYTTYCPLTASTATVEAEHTTVVTVTSCSGGVCTKVPVETGV
ncbi:hypothetical protein WICPIJ_008415, partial [Wickerhamomyces pijperi]